MNDSLNPAGRQKAKQFTGSLVEILTTALLAILIFAQSCNITEERVMPKNMVLNGSWEFRQVGDTAWLPATVPGCVHTDLLDNGKIEDPYYRLNEHDLQWIDKSDWEYRTVFDVPASLLEEERIEIRFEGLDTYADVFLNDSLILEADNMFREWVTDVKPFLVIGENRLRICFQSPTGVGLTKLEAQPYSLPDPPNDLSEIGGMGNKKVSVFTRKAPYHFGWDWGPRLVTSGIWKDVILTGWSQAKITGMAVRQEIISEDTAWLEVILDIEATADRKVTIVGFVNDVKVGEEETQLAEGSNRFSKTITIEAPELWWPNGLGDQTLYKVSFMLSTGSYISEKESRIGIRDIKLIRDKDEDGESFYFSVNGHPVFMKGANYIPQDVFLNRVTPEKYEHIIQSAVDANMNMLRVWGGGIYEKDLFYDLCDEKGILVWQDFMFACSMYPGDSAFLESVKLEAIDNVTRLRNHPCIALWCGNNENLSAWYNWGWKSRVTREQGEAVADRIWKAYEDKFHRILPEVVKTYDPDRFYWSSSPSAGTGIPENWVAGDVHYWGVWWGQEPFDNYRTKKCRFMSEYGFQSFPELNTVKKYAEDRDWDIYSDVMKSHQRSSIGNGTIENYMLRSYRKPKDFPMFLYVGQVLQAEGIRMAMEAHRTEKPYCMGSLFWQIDDCWPVASWSSIDYYGNWKAQQYFARKAFRDILLSPGVEEDDVILFVVSDRLEDTRATIHRILMDFDGNILDEVSNEINVKGNSSTLLMSETLQRLLDVMVPANRVLLYYTLEIDGEVYCDNILYLMPVKDLDLPVPDINWELNDEGDRLTLQLHTDKLAKNVYCRVPDRAVTFGDNYFDLLPGHDVLIDLVPGDGTSPEDIRDHLQVISLVDSYARTPGP